MAEKVIVTDQTYAPQLLQWMSNRIGDTGTFSADECRTIAHILVKEDNEVEILAVVAFNKWTTFTCEANIASDGTRRWATRDFFYTFYDYAFRFADKTRLNFTVAPENIDAIRMHEKLGHKFEARLADAFGEGKDALIYGYTRKEWLESRWNKPSPINKNK